MKNPFIFQSYLSPKYFCDRDNETSDLISAFDNRRNITLISIRRLGKTGLLRHVQYKLNRRKDVVPVYLDILNTSTQQDFVNKMVTAVIDSLDQKKDSFVNKAIKQFSKYKPTFSLDSLTGNPQISLDIKDDQEARMSLDVLFGMMAKEKTTFQIAIDEFQQIKQYDNTKLDATLREYIQKMDNIHFIFSGSIQHMMMEIFSDVKKPLYRITGFMHLDKIPVEKYHSFIASHFQKSGKKISDKFIDEILNWTKVHTFYTQYFCNLLFSISTSTVSKTDLQRVKLKILKENEVTYLRYKKLMTAKQWNLVQAIGQEGSVQQPGAKDFISTHKLGAHSTVRQSLKAMIKAEMIYETLESDRVSYQVYDVFLERWLQEVVK